MTELLTPPYTNLRPAWPAVRELALRRLAKSIIVQAVRDARGADDLDAALARAWLGSELCAGYCFLAGMDFEVVRAWVRSGCPIE